MARLNQIIAIEKGIKSKSVQELATVQQTQFVRVFRKLGKRLGDHQPAFSTGHEFQNRTQQRVLAAFSAGHLRLPVKSLHVARPALHVEENHALRFRREMRELLREWRRRDRIRGQQVGQRQPCEATADLPEELPARVAAGCAIGDVPAHVDQSG